MTFGYIYIIWTRECIKCREPIYKIGKTKQKGVKSISIVSCKTFFVVKSQKIKKNFVRCVSSCIFIDDVCFYILHILNIYIRNYIYLN